MSETEDDAPTPGVGATIDYSWFGPPAAVAAAIEDLPNVVGPRELDGVAYVTVRSETPLDLPPGLSSIGPNLSLALVGTWMEGPTEVVEVTNFQARAQMMRTPLPETIPEVLGDPGQYETLFEAVDALCRIIGGETFQAWEFANVFIRDGSFIQGIGPLFGYSSGDIKALFEAAASINP